MRGKSRTAAVLWTGLKLDSDSRLGRYVFDLIGVPYRIRTGVAAVRGRCPGPLDEGDGASAVNSGSGWRDQARAPTAGVKCLFAEIDVLQRLLDLQAAGDGDRGLQIVALFAGDAQLVALNRNLYFQLGVLELSDQLPRESRVDPLPQHDRLPQRVAGSLLRRLVIERRRIDFAPRQMHLQKFVHLLQLELVVGEDGQDAFLALDRAS